MFAPKTNDNIFQKKIKTLFFAQFYPYFVVFAQRESLLKNPANYSYSDNPAFKRQGYRVD